MKAKFAVALLLIAPLLAGCLERGQPTVANTLGEDDDAICRANHVTVGSPEYIACRKDRDVLRNNAAARADRRQRDLGEYMMNHPDHP
jgi:DICT domain-containing protein